MVFHIFFLPMGHMEMTLQKTLRRAVAPYYHTFDHDPISKHIYAIVASLAD